MDLKFGGKPIQAQLLSGQLDLDQMLDTPTRGSRHRRTQSETFFRLPSFNFDDDDVILLDDVVSSFKLDSPGPPPTLPPQQPPLIPPHSPAHFRSLSVGAEFFDGVEFGGGGTRHQRSGSMDGSLDTMESVGVKKAMAPDRLAELSLIDPKRAKRILANRQSAARSKERKTRYTNELERKVQTLQTEATTLSAQITVLQRDTTELTAENKELKFRLQALEQQAHLRDALNETLREELQRLKIAAGEISAVNGNKMAYSHLPPNPRPFIQCGNHQAPQQQQQQQGPPSTASSQTVSGQSRSNFFNFSNGT